MSGKHTPGPWQAEGDEWPISVWQLMTADRAGVRLADVSKTLPSPAPVSEAWANARLMAAAPDLLAALEGLLHPGKHDGPCDNPDGGSCSKHLIASWGREATARAAIAKATGEAAS